MDLTKYYTVPFRQSSPNVIVNPQGEKSGYMIKFLCVLERLDNISVITIPSTEQSWGEKVGNSWNGLLGMLERNEGDFSLVPLTLSSERFNDFPTSHPFLIVRTKILFGTNQSDENDIYSVVDKWIIVVFFGLALLIYVAGKVISKYKKAQSEVPWMFLLQGLLGTSPQSLTCNGVNRFLSVTWSLASFVVLVFVSSEMTSQFSSKSEAQPFDNMDDIFHFPDAKPLLVKSGATFTFIQKNAPLNPAFAEVIKRAEANAHTCYQKKSGLLKKADLQSGIENRENFIILSDFFLWNVIMARYSRTGICKMKLSKPLMITYSAMFFKKNISQTLIKTINRRLRQLTEGDCYEDLNPSLKVESHPCQTPETPDAFVVINVQAFMAIFRVCLLGFSASFITLMLEIYVKMSKVKVFTL